VVSDLFRAHYRRLVGLAALLVDDRATAEDVVQDAFAGLYRRWPHLRDHQAAVAYLNRAVANGGREPLRRGRTRSARLLRMTPVSEELASAENAAVADDEADRMVLGNCAVPRRQRQVLVLRYYLDQSEAEIAETLDVSPGSVKTHASRALASLARSLEATP
jgi:RNA polymerase sigma-70 factor (sigma-E family)